MTDALSCARTRIVRARGETVVPARRRQEELSVMAKSKKMKKSRRRADAGPAGVGTDTYVDMLATLKPVAGGLAEELAARQERRNQHLFSMLTQVPVFLEALAQLQEALVWLAGRPGVDSEVAHLLGEAGRRVVTGTDALLSQPDPRVMDEARYLMELEFLFLDFAGDPARLDVWSRTPQLERNRLFDFGSLRRRHQEATGVHADRVLFDQEEYRLHGSTTHPGPVDRDPPLVAPDVATGLFFDAADLLHHTMRAWTAGLTVVGATGSAAGRSLEAQRPALDAVDVATQLIDENYRGIGLVELTGGHTDRSNL
jgi:hypothetical protein